MLEVVSSSLAINQYVVKKYQNKLPYVGLEKVVHSALKSGRCVGEAKGHHQKLVVALMSSKRGLLYVFLPHADLVVTHLQVNLGEVADPSQLIQ